MRPAAYQQQRGAVTLIGALFLIVVVVGLLGIVQRMAASDISDTGLHNDGIEALFLAEAGLERAAGRYAGGIPCAGLAGDTDTVGRGDFLVVSSSMIGTLCQVRVEGRVTSTTVDNTARRTVEGAFSKSGFSGWAVGDTAGGVAVLLAWDGSSWILPGPYPAVPPANLNDVFCITGSDCWAVGDSFDGAANINHWDGTTWSNIDTTALPDKHLNSVYCVASDDCWAVGQKDGKKANTNHWDGIAWSNIAAPDLFAKDLNDVYCVASDDCWTVGKSNGKKSANINHWDDSAWSNIAVPDVPAKDLNSVYCVASDDCWAVGKKSGSENINYWNGGSWDRDGPYAGIANEDLNAVYMVSATEGFITGKNGVLAGWDGSSWDGLPSPTGTTVNSVSVIPGGGGGGGVKLVQWTEVIQ